MAENRLITESETSVLNVLKGRFERKHPTAAQILEMYSQNPKKIKDTFGALLVTAQNEGKEFFVQSWHESNTSIEMKVCELVAGFYGVDLELN